MGQEVVTRRRAAALVGAALCLAPVTGARASVDILPEAPPYTPPDTLAAVRDLYRRMTVAVRVNGQGPFPFVVDTGSNRTVIAASLAARLGLPVGEPLAVNGVAGVRMAPATHATLSVGARQIPDSPLMIFPEDDIGGPGLLGLDDLDRQAVTLDFRRQTVRVEPGRQLRRDDAAITLKAWRRDGQLLLVDADLDERAVIAFLDTGSDNTIGNLALRARARRNEVNRPSLSATILSATGQTMDGSIMDLPRLRLGQMTISSWPVTFADLHTFSMWRLIDRPAMLLGVDVLSRFDYVCLDFARDEVRFRLPKGV